MRIRRLAAALTAAGALALLPVQQAPADDPVPLDREGQITDEVDALGERRGAVERALTSLDREHSTQLWVAYVRDFSGRGAQSWADATAERNGLGQNDVLLAVATRDRQYAVSAASDGDFTQSDITAVNAEAIEPALRQNDWAGAAIGGADGYAAVLEGEPVPAPDITPGPADPGADEGITGSEVLVPVLLIGGAVVAAAFLISSRNRRSRAGPAHGPGTGAGPGWGEEREPVMPLPALDSRAKDLLVETDDAIRTSQEELGFASAQFGEETAKPFDEAIDYAKGEVTAAFRLRQQLDDAYPEHDPAKRAMLEEIISRCTDANARLDAESEAFDKLRAVVTNAPEVLANAEAAANRLPDRLGAAETALAAMTETYAPSSFAAVAEGPREAKDRLQFATKNLAQARSFLAADDRNSTAVHVRAAEGAIDQAEILADAVVRRGAELRQAAEKLQGALHDMQADIADAQGIVSATPADQPTADLQGRIGRAQSVHAEVARELSGGHCDPLAALRRVEEADAVLEEALAGARERADVEQRARGLLDQALLGARSEVAAARDFVTTHRGGIGSTARTRLHEAERHLRQAAEYADRDATDAPQHARRAGELAREARELAEQDVTGYGGPFGGGAGRGRVTVGGGGMGTGMLGGIILGGMLGGGGGFGGGGFGGGGFGGGPGSFGGGGTRGRMGGGGRF